MSRVVLRDWVSDNRRYRRWMRAIERDCRRRQAIAEHQVAVQQLRDALLDAVTPPLRRIIDWLSGGAQ